MTLGSSEKDASDGFTLIEVLISVAIMGVAVTAILAALQTAVAGGRVHRYQSNAAATLTSAVERLKSVKFKACATTGESTYLTAMQNAVLPSDWLTNGYDPATRIRIQSVKYWDGSSFVSTCHDNDTDDTEHFLRAQQIQVMVLSPSDALTDTCLTDDPRCLDLVKRDV